MNSKTFRLRLIVSWFLFIFFTLFLSFHPGHTNVDSFIRYLGELSCTLARPRKNPPGVGIELTNTSHETANIFVKLTRVPATQPSITHHSGHRPKLRQRFSLQQAKLMRRYRKLYPSPNQRGTKQRVQQDSCDYSPSTSTRFDYRQFLPLACNCTLPRY